MQTKMVSCGTRASTRLPPHVLIRLEPGIAEQDTAKQGTARQRKAGKAGKHPVGATS